MIFINNESKCAVFKNDEMAYFQPDSLTRKDTIDISIVPERSSVFLGRLFNETFLGY